MSDLTRYIYYTRTGRYCIAGKYPDGYRLTFYRGNGLPSHVERYDDLKPLNERIHRIAPVDQWQLIPDERGES